MFVIVHVYGGKLAALDDAQAHSAADDELARMEAKLGLGTPAPTSTITTSTGGSDIDAQLQQLEARVSGGQGGTPPAA